MAIAAFSATAFLGASSALAGSTLLCKNNTVSEHPTLAECGEVKELHAVSVKLENNAWVLGKAKLLSEAGTIECHLLVKGTRNSGALTTNAPAEFNTEIKYSECNLGCSVYDLTGGAGTNPLGNLLVLRTAVELATAVGDNFNIVLNCPFIFSCHYNGNGLTGHGLQPSPVHGSAGKGHTTYTNAAVNLTLKLPSNFNCPTTSALHVLLQSLETLYIRL